MARNISGVRDRGIDMAPTQTLLVGKVKQKPRRVTSSRT
jgi:hypothetical protein